jgi:hypothetical protein
MHMYQKYVMFSFLWDFPGDVTKTLASAVSFHYPKCALSRRVTRCVCGKSRPKCSPNGRPLLRFVSLYLGPSGVSYLAYFMATGYSIAAVVYFTVMRYFYGHVVIFVNIGLLQGCQGFLRTKYQNGKKIYQNTTNYTKCP